MSIQIKTIIPVFILTFALVWCDVPNGISFYSEESTNSDFYYIQIGRLMNRKVLSGLSENKQKLRGAGYKIFTHDDWMKFSKNEKIQFCILMFAFFKFDGGQSQLFEEAIESDKLWLKKEMKNFDFHRSFSDILGPEEIKKAIEYSVGFLGK